LLPIPNSLKISKYLIIVDVVKKSSAIFFQLILDCFFEANLNLVAGCVSKCREKSQNVAFIQKITWKKVKKQIAIKQKNKF